MWNAVLSRWWLMVVVALTGIYCGGCFYDHDRRDHDRWHDRGWDRDHGHDRDWHDRDHDRY